MIYSVIDRKNHKFYTYLSKVFEGLGGEQNNYNWLISDCECYPRDKEIEDMLNREYCWLSGEELSALIKKEDFQWVWAVLCGFEKDITLDEVLKHPLPTTEHKGYYKKPITLQHPLSSIEIVPCDSSWTLILGKHKDIIDRYMKAYPNNQDLSELNEKTSMKKVIVIGCPGSGKSTFARGLCERTGLPLVHLDMLNWNADRTTVEKGVFLERLRDAMSGDEWIIDGNYGGSMEMRLKECDTVFFLDYPVQVCLDGIRSRRGTPRSDMPWVEEKDDEEFIAFIKDFNDVSRPKILALLENYKEKVIFIFKNREEADKYLLKSS